MVSPFNFPLNLAAHKIAPAIAAGCPFLLKPASKTPRITGVRSSARRTCRTRSGASTRAAESAPPSESRRTSQPPTATSRTASSAMPYVKANAVSLIATQFARPTLWMMYRSQFERFSNAPSTTRPPPRSKQ